MKDYNASLAREDQNFFPVQNLARRIDRFSKGLEVAIVGLDGWAKIYDNSLDSLFTNAGEAIPTKC